MLLGVLGLLVTPAAASHWQPGDGNPAERASQARDSFSTGVFADDWSPSGDDDSSDDTDEDSSSDDDQPDDTGDDSGSDDSSSEEPDDSNDPDDTGDSDDTDRDESAEEDVFSTGVFSDDWAETFLTERFGTPDEEESSDEPADVGDGDDSSDTDDDTGDNTGDDSTGDNSGDSPDDDTGDDTSGDGTGDHTGPSHERWGGHPPWEGTQYNENYCYTHFHRDEFDETHCGWDLDVPRPSENGDSATEDMTVREAPAPESLGLEWISYPNPRDVMPNPYTAQDQPSFKLCTVLLNQDDEPITGHTVSDALVSMDIDGVPYGEAHPATFGLPLTQYSDMLGRNPNMPEGDGWLDSECMEFANMAPGTYAYSRPDVTGSDADEIEFVGVTEYWNQQNMGEPFDGQVSPYGSSDLSDGSVTLDTSHDGRHIEVVYVFRLK